MNVLSLFDGMSCGRIALDRAEFKVNNYFASEVDKWAMKVSSANYPDIIQLGDVRGVQAKNLPKIDLLIAGSPCQGFSLAGKQLNFNDPRSALFFEFVRILKEVKEINPDVFFLLENVKMKGAYRDKISDLLECNPTLINSSLVSAQNRERLYWTNIPYVGKPEDKGEVLSDILEPEVDEKYFLSKRLIAGFERATKKAKENGHGFNFETRDKSKKAKCITTKEGQRTTGNYLVHNLQPRNGKGQGEKGHLQKNDGKSYCLATTPSQAIETTKIRKLTPLECERLQTVPDNYTNHVSDSQRYRMLGNGWTVDVVAWVFSFMRVEKVKEAKMQQIQTDIFDFLED